MQVFLKIFYVSFRGSETTEESRKTLQTFLDSSLRSEWQIYTQDSSLTLRMTVWCTTTPQPSAAPLTGSKISSLLGEGDHEVVERLYKNYLLSISSIWSQFNSSSLLLSRFAGMVKLSHFLAIILEIFHRVFLLYGENKSKNLINSSNWIFGISLFFTSQIRQLLTFGAGENAFAGTVLRYWTS